MILSLHAPHLIGIGIRYAIYGYLQEEEEVSKIIDWRVGENEKERETF